jgi:hypothetical protein
LEAGQEVGWMGTSVPENGRSSKFLVFKLVKKIIVYLSTVVNIFKKMVKLYCHSRRYVFQ